MKTTEFTTELELTSKKAESRLRQISKWILIIGLAVAGVLLFLSCDFFVDHVEGYGLVTDFEEGTGWLVLIGSLSVAILSIITWAVANVLCGISFNLRMMNSKMQKDENL